MKITPEQLKLYAVTDRTWLSEGETLVSVTEELLKAGVTCVQLREKQADDEQILKEAIALRELCHHYHVPLIINDRPDLALRAGADGVHVGLSDMGIQKAREMGKKAVRLDALSCNLPAQKLYRSMGFAEVGTARWQSANLGWTDFVLYELFL